MRRRVYVDGVEVQYAPPGAIERQGPPERNGRQRFEAGVKRSGRALWAYLTGDGGDIDRLARAAEVFQEDPDKENDDAAKP